MIPGPTAFHCQGNSSSRTASPTLLQRATEGRKNNLLLRPAHLLLGWACTEHWAPACSMLFSVHYLSLTLCPFNKCWWKPKGNQDASAVKIPTVKAVRWPPHVHHDMWTPMLNLKKCKRRKWIAGRPGNLDKLVLCTSFNILFSVLGLNTPLPSEARQMFHFQSTLVCFF